MTLATAASFNPGAVVTVGDSCSSCSGSDTINGASSAAIGVAYGQMVLVSDGVSKWTIVQQPGSPSSVEGGTFREAGMTQILVKRSTTSGSKPASLAPGEIALNLADGLLFWANASGALKSTSVGLDAYRYKKAIDAATSAAGGVGEMLAYCAATSSPGSNAMQAATTSIPSPANGDFETLVLLPWLQAASTASPPGVGLSTTSSPTLASVLAAPRSAGASVAF